MYGKLYIGDKGYIPCLEVNKDGNPVGTVITFAGTTAPKGYLLCDGRDVSRTIYSDLFSVIGTTYGPGDGSSSFNLPDYTQPYYYESLIPESLIELTFTNDNEQTFVAPYNGWLSVTGYDSNGANTTSYILNQNNQLKDSYQQWNQTGEWYLSIPAKKDDVIKIQKTRGTWRSVIFIKSISKTFNIIAPHYIKF